jgi:hypothetical protein
VLVVDVARGCQVLRVFFALGSGRFGGAHGRKPFLFLFFCIRFINNTRPMMTFAFSNKWMV